MKIYTRAGDKGKTRLVGGSSVQKNHLRIEAYGTVDELNSVLGIVLAKISVESSPKLATLSPILLRIQSELFVVGGALACENLETLQKLPQLEQSHVEHLEQEIDRMDKDLQPLKQFILPGGHEIAGHLHLGRTIARRSERNSVSLLESAPEVEIYVRYLNRLSDHLFTCARWSNFALGHADQLWSRP